MPGARTHREVQRTAPRSAQPGRGHCAQPALQARAAGTERSSGSARRAFSPAVYPCGKLAERGTGSGLQIRKGSNPDTFMSSSLSCYVQSGSRHSVTIGDAGSTALTENT